MCGTAHVSYTVSGQSHCSNNCCREPSISLCTASFSKQISHPLHLQLIRQLCNYLKRHPFISASVSVSVRFSSEQGLEVTSGL